MDKIRKQEDGNGSIPGKKRERGKENYEYYSGNAVCDLCGNRRCVYSISDSQPACHYYLEGLPQSKIQQSSDCIEYSETGGASGMFFQKSDIQ